MSEAKRETPGTPADDRLKIEAFAESIGRLREELRRRIVGQDEVITQLIAGILAEGHCLIVGLPGLAKTLLVSSLAELLSLSFKRIQFTPDLMPSDITGASILSDQPAGGRGFQFMKGPVFAHIVLADEINRTPPKTQSALMEAMEERQVSIGGVHFPLERPFFVLATENPIEQEGTYPLPVSQLDRFLFSIQIDYPSESEEFQVLVMTTSSYRSDLRKLFSREEVLEALNLSRRIEVEPRMLDYAARLVRATRPSAASSPPMTKDFVAWGGGPRATQALLLGAKALALMSGRHQVVPDDIHAVAMPTLRHRIILKYHARAEGVSADDIVLHVLQSLPDGLYRKPPPAIRPESGGGRGLFSRLFSRGRASTATPPGLRGT
ncbi:MAG TPA: AAA family ATPase [Planctomycetota bacterium]|nr:AAA family ATPase [Planctomycetota bacterium]